MTAVSSTAAAQAASASASQSKAALNLDTNFNDFLLLLTTQLKNQDPTQPMDTSAFTQQLVAMSGVEQQINTNNQLQTLINLFNGNQINNAVGYIGKVITADGNQSQLGANGATFSYDLASAAAGTTVSIKDSSGALVFSGQGTTSAGKNLVTWDGINSFTGAKMPAGTYSITVQAKDAGGAAITATTHTIGIVSSVETKDGVMQLDIGDIKVPIDKVTSVQLPNASA